MICTQSELTLLADAVATAQGALAKLQHIQSLAVLAPPPPPSTAFEDHLVVRAGGDDWSAFAASGGVTMVDGVAVLDGIDGSMTAAIDRDLAGHSLWIVARVLSTNNAQDCIVQANPGTSACVSLAARTIGQFLVQMRLPSGYGASAVASMNPSNVERDIVGELTLVGIIWDEAGHVACVNGAHGGGQATRPASVPMTQIVLGKTPAGAFNHLEVHEAVLLSATRGEAVESYVQDVAARFGVAVPRVSPLIGSKIAITGDSNAVGVGSPIETNRWCWLTAHAFLADFAMLATAGAQLSPYGLDPVTQASKISRSICRVMTAANLSGKSAVINFAGANDWKNGVPLGVPGDTDEMTVRGALWQGYHMWRPNAAPGSKAYICTTVYPDTAELNALGLTVLEYDAAIREVVAAVDDPDFVVVDARTLGLGAQHFGDGIHLNDAGHAELAAMLIDRVSADHGIFRG